MLHILDLSGQHIKSFTAHTASVSDISMDVTGDFIATASIDGETSTTRATGYYKSYGRSSRLHWNATLRTGRRAFALWLGNSFIQLEAASTDCCP